MNKIKVLVVDENKSTRANMIQLMEIDKSIDIVGEAKNGEEVLAVINATEPEIIVMDTILDGVETNRNINTDYPHISVIIISNDESLDFKKSILPGAKAFLVKPLSPNELTNAIRELAEISRTSQELRRKIKTTEFGPDLSSQNKLITIFGTKGGVGKSVICTNMAVAAAQKYRQKVALVDLDIQFGDVSIMMNLNPRRTISELTKEDADISSDILEGYMYERHGVNILAAPNKPELAELVTPGAVERILKTMKRAFNYTFIDTPSFIDDSILTALELADNILLVSTLDLPTIKNVKKGIDILNTLSLLYKTKLILNRSTGVEGVEPLDMERALDMKIQAKVPSDGKFIIGTLNRGIPAVKMNPRATISKSLVDLLNILE